MWDSDTVSICSIVGVLSIVDSRLLPLYTLNDFKRLFISGLDCPWHISGENSKAGTWYLKAIRSCCIFYIWLFIGLYDLALNLFRFSWWNSSICCDDMSLSMFSLLRTVFLLTSTSYSLTCTPALMRPCHDSRCKLFLFGLWVELIKWPGGDSLPCLRSFHPRSFCELTARIKKA